MILYILETYILSRKPDTNVRFCAEKRNVWISFFRYLPNHNPVKDVLLCIANISNSEVLNQVIKW